MATFVEYDLTYDQKKRFWDNVRKQADGCWIWTASRNRDGYGQFRVGDRVIVAHRIAYYLHKGPIEAVDDYGQKIVLDHVCRNRDCVNPAHLDPVSILTNTLRGDRYVVA